ncbi:Aspergillopepsin i [Mycena sanguinolenta]|uniref:Aspergillopepsin i n=1 Tax=Mycena sanguinolenta TaxID=230812 RepID=A0A8H7DK88_9AGAR|nr:Aspergillopepsin i [Mycena sanguinolenta]
MPRIRPLLVTLLGLLYSAAAVNIEEQPERRGFSLPATRASERYQAGKRSVTGTVDGTHNNDGSVLVDVTFGSQTLPVVFDTASSILWVWSTYYNGSLTGDLYYNISASTTWAQLPGYTFNISYQDGSGSSGVVGTDKVTMGGLTVTGATLGAANAGTPGPTTVTKNTWMQNIASSLPSPIFAAYLPWGTGAAQSSIDFGYIDSSKYTGTLSTVPLISGTSRWAFTSTSYYVNGVHYSVTSTSSGSAFMAYYAKVPGAYEDSGAWFFPCSTTFPSLTLDVGGVQAPVNHVIDAYSLTLANGTRICRGGIQPSTSMIFGQVFLASNYVVFNDAASTIQIANIVF